MKSSNNKIGQGRAANRESMQFRDNQCRNERLQPVKDFRLKQSAYRWVNSNRALITITVTSRHRCGSGRRSRIVVMRFYEGNILPGRGATKEILAMPQCWWRDTVWVIARNHIELFTWLIAAFVRLDGIKPFVRALERNIIWTKSMAKLLQKVWLDDLNGDGSLFI